MQHARRSIAGLLVLVLAGLQAGATEPETPAAPVNAPGGTAPESGAQEDAGAAARPGGYIVEMIVFRDSASHASPEAWGAESATAASGEAEGGSGRQTAQLLGLVPESAWQLGGIAARLRAGGYIPIAHAAWSETASAWGNHGGLPLARLGIEVPGLTGSVGLERGQFLHLVVSLQYASSNPPAGLGAAAGTVFTIHENRRVRFYDRNYFDAPAFGVIALVTPSHPRGPAAR